MVDSISASLGVDDSDGLIGVAMLGGGVIGAIILPMLSDKFRKRKLFLVLGLGGMLPGVAGLAFADLIAAGPDGAYVIALTASFILGFFVMSAGPIGFQYAAEVSYPRAGIHLARTDAASRSGFGASFRCRHEC